MIITGADAIDLAICENLQINKYADPTEGAKTDIDIMEAYDIMDEDPDLVWVDDGE